MNLIRLIEIFNSDNLYSKSRCHIKGFVNIQEYRGQRHVTVEILGDIWLQAILAHVILYVLRGHRFKLNFFHSFTQLINPKCPQSLEEMEPDGRCKGNNHSLAHMPAVMSVTANHRIPSFLCRSEFSSQIRRIPSGAARGL
jgi:hypothetical protein